MQRKGRVLVVAGSDSGGGAGIQGDIKTVSALGGYAATAITALTAQNTLGVHSVLGVPAAFAALQMRAVLEDIGADAVKTGMLHTASVIEAVADVLEDYPDIPLILDPVMVAKGGAMLLQENAVEALIRRLLPRALLVTPNVPEAEALVGCKGQEVADCKLQVAWGEKILGMGARAVLIKGGHWEGDEVTDMLMTACTPQPATCSYYTSPRIPTRHTHGTGCALASAIATGIAQGMALNDAVSRAHAWVQGAIRTAPGLGGGQGPLNHGFR